MAAEIIGKVQELAAFIAQCVKLLSAWPRAGALVMRRGGPSAPEIEQNRHPAVACTTLGFIQFLDSHSSRRTDIAERRSSRTAAGVWQTNEPDSTKPEAIKLKRLRLLRAASWFGIVILRARFLPAPISKQSWHLSPPRLLCDLCKWMNTLLGRPLSAPIH